MSARIAATSVTLGDEQFLLAPLTIAQVQAIEPLLSDFDLQSKPISFAIAVLRIGFSRSPNIVFDDIEAPASDLPEAMNVVLRLGGFVEAAKPGKPPAAARNASTGAKSKPASRRP